MFVIYVFWFTCNQNILNDSTSNRLTLIVSDEEYSRNESGALTLDIYVYIIGVKNNLGNISAINIGVKIEQRNKEM